MDLSRFLIKKSDGLFLLEKFHLFSEGLTHCFLAPGQQHQPQPSSSRSGVEWGTAGRGDEIQGIVEERTDKWVEHKEQSKLTNENINAAFSDSFLLCISVRKS